MELTIDKCLDKLNYSSSDSDSDRYNSSNSSCDNKDLDESYNCNIDKKYIDNINIKLTDFGTSINFSNINKKEIQTRYYRAPEVILKCNYNYKVDMWSLGCVIFELLTGNILFDPKKTRESNRDRNHIKLIYEIIGELPKNMIKESERNKVFFKRNGLLKGIAQINHNPLNNILNNKFKNKIPKNELLLLIDFMKKLLEIDPNKRFDSLQCLKHKWLSNELYSYN